MSTEPERGVHTSVTSERPDDSRGSDMEKDVEKLEGDIEARESVNEQSDDKDDHVVDWDGEVCSVF